MDFSYSRIETFKQCPLKFKYNYLEKPEIPPSTTIESFLGTIVHSTLQKLYEDLKYSKLNSLDDLLSFYYKQWDSEYFKTQITIVKEGLSPENYKQTGKEFIKNYYEKYKPFNQGKTLGTELKFNLQISDPETSCVYNITGYIDRLTLVSDNFIEIHDYKTNNVPKTQEQIEKDAQLPLYAIAVKKLYPFVEKIDLVWHFLSGNLELRTSKTNLELEDLKKEFIQHIKDIEKAIEFNEFPAQTSALCDWCEYKVVCPMKAHELKTKDLEKNEFLNEPGVQLVNKYAEIEEKRKQIVGELDKQLEKLKEAIIIYSQQNNLERIVGANASLLIKQYENVKIPDKGTKEREDLENLIIQNNLWNDLSDLSYYKLSRSLGYHMFSKELDSQIRKYIETTKIHRFYLSQKK
ncbi:MAG TPA: PD-(D/E)XK nuclease family protein [Candidatus Diapherotrites archaeon]|nr:PD-(D/E)XK nuclease family protein [Candidatus Diapherotrites archaeon]